MRVLNPRQRYLDNLLAVTDNDFVRIITGVRRCGKSTLLELYRRHLREHGTPEDAIMVINFEDHANAALREPPAFHDAVKERIAAGLRYLHVDEVQELENWARVINSLRLNEQLEICVTGSNASLFVGESLTYLAGRYIEIPMLPLSLAEFIEFRYSADEHPGLDRTFQEWVTIGGFPATVQLVDPVVIRQANSSLFDSIFTRDISLRGQIRDTDAFLRVARFLFDNAGNPVSTNRIVGHLKHEGLKASSETVDRYLGLMSDAHLIYQCRDYDTKGKRWLSTNGKFYFVDPGLRTALLGSRAFNFGHDLENMVYLELRRRGYQVSTGKVPGGEIDFIANDGQRTLYIQVALTVAEPATLARELAPFDTLPAGSRCVLLTTDRFAPDTGNVSWRDAIEVLAGAALD